MDKVSAAVSQDNVRKDVNKFLHAYINHKLEASLAMDGNYADLWRAIEAFASAGGKRLRPYLLMLLYRSYGGKDYDALIPIAAAQEFLHLGLLVHDDIIDNDFIRYGQDNVAGRMRNKYQATALADTTHYAEGAAILAGDLLISAAHHVIVNSPLDDKHKIIALNRLEEGIFMVGGGELIDMESVMHDFAATDTLKIAELKTAGYSFIVPLVTGAQLAGASHSQLELLRKLAIALGIGFQLADDLLGLYGDEVVTGKSNLGDIREGKRTYLMSHAFELASVQQLKTLEKIVGQANIQQDDADKVRAIVEECGAKAATRQKINQCVAEAHRLIDELAIDTAAKGELIGFLKKATERSL